MKVIVAGSRDITNETLLAVAVFRAGFKIDEVVCGMARGVDEMGWHYGYAMNIPVKEYPANWDKYGKRAGYVRNADMAEYADALIAIWDGVSKGTKHMIDIMEKLNKPVYVHLVPK